jgi:protein-L-isoaspartate(D-aspartate) O-methyltransferase
MPRADCPARLAARVRAAGVRDERVITAIAAVPRADFVPDEHAARAYRDEPLAIPHGQVTTQPSLIAAMLEALQLDGSERALEVGTGHGYQTALLARLTDNVFSVERFADLSATARRNLARHRVRNVELVVGDGSAGLPEHAPFDAIVVSAAFTRVPPPLAEQLAERGRLVQPIGPGGRDEVTLFEGEGHALTRRARVIGAHFVKLYGAHAFASRQ